MELDNYKLLKKKISLGEVNIGVVGLGYVGLPLAAEFALKGIEVTGVDVSRKKIKKLLSGESYIQDVDSKLIKSLCSTEKLNPTSDFSELKNMDAVVICVPTPLRKSRDPDLSFIVDASEKVAENISGGTIVILESTSYPGTTREILLQEIKRKNPSASQEVFVAFSPERVDPGNSKFGIGNTPKVVGGIDSKSTELAEKLYQMIVKEVVTVKSCEEAEMVKLLENTFRAVNIGLINEMAQLCDRFSLDIWRIVKAAASKPFGFMPFYPGPGLGGHCLPIDPQFLSWKAKSNKFYPHFIDYAEEINRSMPEYVVGKVGVLLNEKKKSINGSDILLMGVSYKKNVGDTRESPAYEIVEFLKKMKARISYIDPYVNCFPDAEKVEAGGVDYSSYDCVVIVTEHEIFDWPEVIEKSQLILDCRGVTLEYEEEKKKVVRI